MPSGSRPTISNLRVSSEISISSFMRSPGRSDLYYFDQSIDLDYFEHRTMQSCNQTMETLMKLKNLKETIKDTILQGTFCLPLYSFTKEFSFQHLRYVNKPKKRIAFNLETVSCLVRLLEIMEISIGLIEKGEFITKRNLYYKLVHYYKIYSLIDSDIDLLTFNLSIAREDLHIVSSSRCLVFGQVTFNLDGNQLKCLPKIISNIPSFRSILEVKTACKNLIILEKESALYQIHQLLLRNSKQEQNIMTYWLSETIFVSAKGYPDNTCRGVIQSLANKIENIYYLGDQDIYGVDILLCYSIGYNSYSSILHKLKWIQFDELAKAEQIQHQYLPMSRQDRTKSQEILSKKYFKDIESYSPLKSEDYIFKEKLLLWKNKLLTLIESNRKIELEAFFKYLPDNWIEKIIEGGVAL